MGEIKGQLIGMLIVFSVAAVIGTLLVTGFQTNADSIYQELAHESNYSATSLINVFKTLFIR